MGRVGRRAGGTHITKESSIFYICGEKFEGSIETDLHDQEGIGRGQVRGTRSPSGSFRRASQTTYTTCRVRSLEC